MSYIPNVPPKVFTLSAVAVGYLLLDDSTANEQNALGNWLMLVAQLLCTNAYYKQLQNERQSNSGDMSDSDTLAMLQKIVNSMNEEIKELKKQMNSE